MKNNVTKILGFLIIAFSVFCTYTSIIGIPAERACNRIASSNYYLYFDPKNYKDVADISFSFEADKYGDKPSDINPWINITVRFYDSFNSLSATEQKSHIKSFESEFINNFYNKWEGSDIENDFNQYFAFKLSNQ